MASGWTNKGKMSILEAYFRNTGSPTNYYVALVTATTTPIADINTFSELTEITAGNGYATGGFQLAKNDTDFDVLTEDDTNDRGYVQIKDIVWTASGGSIPSAGDGARHAVLLDDSVTIASREVYAYWDLTSDRQVSTGQTLGGRPAAKSAVEKSLLNTGNTLARATRGKQNFMFVQPQRASGETPLGVMRCSGLRI
jgi:hypothetical protein